LIWIFYLITEKYMVLSFLGFIFPLSFLLVEIWRNEKHSTHKLNLEKEPASTMQTTLHDHE